MAVEIISIKSIRVIFLTMLLLNTVAAQSDCRQTRCGRHGPIIRFPFQLKNDEQPQEGCSYPGFFLYCTDDHDTVLKLPENHQVQLSVRSINYASQVIELYDSQNCLPEKLIQLLNSSTTPFQRGSASPDIESVSRYNHDITFFNCSSSGLQYLQKNPLDGPVSSVVQDMYSCPIYAAPEYNSVDVTDLIFCSKMFNTTRMLYATYDVGDFPPYLTKMSSLFLFWESPNCTKCELQGKNCKLKNNGAMRETECFQFHKHRPSPWIAIGSVTGSVTIVLVIYVVYRVQKFYKMLAEDEVRVEKFLEDYRVLKPTRFSYVDLKRITKGFKEKLGEGAHGTVFKGMLSSNIAVAVKMLNNSKGDGQEFINEVGIMGKIHHVNVIRLVGFCADGHHRALVYEYYPLGSLQNFISLFSPNDWNSFLGWEKLHGIALGIAKGLEYLHMGCEQRILHFDINPHNVLLDNNYTPKMTDFGLAKLCSRDKSTVSVTAAKGTLGYIAPEVFSRNFGNGNVSYKSDVYSYGMLLLEIVGGRKNMEQTAEDVFHVLYPEWIHNLLEGKEIHIHIDNEDDIEIAKKLATVGLWCIQWHPVDRPSMTTVVQMLEVEGVKLTMPPNPLDKTTRTRTRSSIVPRRIRTGSNSGV